MRKVIKKLSAAILVMAMVCTSFFGYLPSLDVLAAEPVTAHLKFGSGNANGHFGSATPEAFVLSDNADVTDAELKAQVKLLSDKANARFRFVTKYKDDTHWSYIAYDKGGWLCEYKNGNNTAYPSLSNLPVIEKNDVFEITTSYQADKMTVQVKNVTKNTTGTAHVTAAPALELKSQAGKVGFGCGTWGTELTDIQFSKVSIGGVAVANYNAWKLYKEGLAGQVWEASVTAPAPEPEQPNPQPETPSQNDRKWFELSGGSNNGGGHSYGDANAHAPVVTLDKSKTVSEMAKAVLTNNKATKKDVDNALAALVKITKAMNKELSSNQKPAAPTAPVTGDATSPVMPIAMVLLAGAAVVFVVRRKRAIK